MTLGAQPAARAQRLGRIAGPAAGLVVAGSALLLQGSISPAARVAAVAVTMAVLWMSEALPLSATALLPLCLFPLLGVDTPARVATAYADPVVFLFLGGFLLARCIEDSGLHRRIAVRVVSAIGEQPRRQVLGFLLTAALLSMWISNTAAALVLLPVALAVAGPALQADPVRGRAFASALLLGVAYGASIGGVGTPVGSPPNAIFLAQLGAIAGQPRIDFAHWLLVGVPFVALFVPVAGWWLCRPLGAAPIAGCREALQAQRAALGPMDGDQKWVAALFALAAAGWILRSPIRIGDVAFPGWSALLGPGTVVDDAVVAIAVSAIAFALPSSQRPGQRLLTWDSASQIAWGVLLLFGGGLALAQGFTHSGLSASLGQVFSGLGQVPAALHVVLVTTLVIFLTELTSNTATTTVMMPILASLALALGISPLLLMWPAAVAASCAFMLPVATPPNAVVFSSGHVPLRHMLRAGLFLNLAGIVLISLLALGPARWFLLP